MPTTEIQTQKTGYTIKNAEPHSYGMTADTEDIHEALDMAWGLYKMTECMAVVIDNDPNGDGTVPPTAIYRVGAEYIGE